MCLHMRLLIWEIHKCTYDLSFSFWHALCSVHLRDATKPPTQASNSLGPWNRFADSLEALAAHLVSQFVLRLWGESH